MFDDKEFLINQKVDPDYLERAMKFIDKRITFNNQELDKAVAWASPTFGISYIKLKHEYLIWKEKQNEIHVT